MLPHLQYSYIKNKFEALVSSSYKCQASVLSSVLTRLNKYLKRRTLEPSACHSSQTDRVIVLGSWTDRVIVLGSWTDRVIALRQISVTALCCSSI